MSEQKGSYTFVVKNPSDPEKDVSVLLNNFKQTSMPKQKRSYTVVVKNESDPEEDISVSLNSFEESFECLTRVFNECISDQGIVQCNLLCDTVDSAIDYIRQKNHKKMKTENFVIGMNVDPNQKELAKSDSDSSRDLVECNLCKHKLCFKYDQEIKDKETGISYSLCNQCFKKSFE